VRLARLARLEITAAEPVEILRLELYASQPAVAVAVLLGVGRLLVVAALVGLARLVTY
jgi:hypothetical protein